VPRAIVEFSQVTITDFILIDGWAANAATELCTSKTLAVACSHMANTAIRRLESVIALDDACNRKPSKKRSVGRIDGLVALALAIGVAPLQATPIDVEALIGDGGSDGDVWGFAPCRYAETMHRDRGRMAGSG
jgi:hypothetical protein